MSEVTEKTIEKIAKRIRHGGSGIGKTPIKVNPKIGERVQAEKFEQTRNLCAALSAVNLEVDKTIAHLKEVKAPKSVVTSAESARQMISDAYADLLFDVGNYYYFGEEGHL